MAEGLPLDDDKKVEKMVDYLQQGGTIQDIYGISDKDMEVMFFSATRYLQRHEFKEAADSFLFLTFLNPYISQYWMGLGEGLRQLKDYEKAIEAYLLSSMMNYEDPRPYFHSGSCFLALAKPQAALERFRLAVEYCHGKNEYGSLKEISLELVDDLTHKVAEGNEV